MVNNQIKRLLDFANQQIAAEAFFLQAQDGGVLPNSQGLISRLTDGNNHSSKFTSVQATQFTTAFEVLAQYRNDPQQTGADGQTSRTGFSGTLFKSRATGELTLSFRSTEFIDDAVRDNKATNDLELRQLGWALGQIAEMEAWYKNVLLASPNLLGGKTFNVTGYSLGGHLATAFNILRREEQQAGLLENVVGRLHHGGQIVHQRARPIEDDVANHRASVGRPGPKSKVQSPRFARSAKHCLA